MQPERVDWPEAAEGLLRDRKAEFEALLSAVDIRPVLADYLWGEVHSVVVFPRALTDAEIALLTGGYEELVTRTLADPTITAREAG